MLNIPDKKDFEMMWWLFKNMIKQFVLGNFVDANEAYHLICMFLKYNYKRKEE